MKASAIETEVPGGDLNCIKAAGFMSIETSPVRDDFFPTSPSDLSIIISHMRSTDGPVTTLPLPHHVHYKVRGWHQTRPRTSPTIPAQFSLDKQSYAELGLNLPRHR